MNDIERVKLSKLDRAYVEAKVDRGGDYADMFTGRGGDTADAVRLRRLATGMTPAEIENDLQAEYKAFVETRKHYEWHATDATATAPPHASAAGGSNDAFAGMSDAEVAMIWKQSAGDVGKAKEQIDALRTLKERDAFEAGIKERVARVQAREAEQRAELQAHIERDRQVGEARRAAQLAAARERAIAILAEQEMARNGGK